MKVISNPPLVPLLSLLLRHPPPAVPRIGETFQSGLHGRSIPCIIREEEPSGLFIAGHRILRNTLVRLDKDVLLLPEHHENTEILTSTL